MGCWDELCLLCGVSSSGPNAILGIYQVENAATEIVKELDLDHTAHPGLFEIVKEALCSSLPDRNKRPEWLPYGMGSDGAVEPDPQHLQTWRSIAVGYFRSGISCNAKAPARIKEDRYVVPDGQHVRVRQVVGLYAGDYSRILWTTDHPLIAQAVEVEVDAGSSCSVAVFDNSFNPNIATCERCYYYLKYWLDVSGLPPSPDGRNLSFPAELYEIVNSRNELRDTTSALLPCLDYDGIGDSHEQWQSCFMPCRRGTKRLARDIQAGLRGSDLIPAILRDCRAWMFMRPDTWPLPNSTTGLATQLFTQITAVADHETYIALAPICLLPAEILLLILPDLPLWTLLSLSSTCRQLRSLITTPQFFRTVIADAIISGSMRWILPVQGLLREDERAFNAIRLWLPEGVTPPAFARRAPQSDDEEEPSMNLDDEDESMYGLPLASKPWYYVRRIPSKEGAPRVEPLLQHKDFALLPFLRACWESDSMMNRRRLWGMVKQFDGLWRDYRWRGWEMNRFFPSEEILDQLSEEPEGYRPPCER